MQRIKYILLPVFLLLIGLSTASAQNFGIDFENIRVDDLSDQQIEQLIERMEERGLSVSDVESLATARGMPAGEVSKLRSRINEVRASRSAEGEQRDGDTRSRSQNKPAETETARQQMQPDTLDVLFEEPQDDSSEVFGSNIFNSKNLTFEPSLNIPTPKNYVLGPGDELIIDIWGASENTYQLPVSPEGAVQIPNLGPVHINGMTIEEAREKLTNQLSQIYSGLKGDDKNTFIQISLGDIRSIKVSIVGEVKIPGTYTLSSLSTVFNALYAAGGPNKNGSYRSIKILRDGGVHKTVDLYDFLVSGDLSDNITLKDQDIIKIDSYVNRVQVKGEAKQIGLFETVEGETFEDLLEYTGGFNQHAYTKRVTIERNTPTEKSIIDVRYPEQANTELKSGDVISIGKILERFENKVTVEGPVFRPGDYQLEENPTLHDLISNAEGLMGDAFMERAIIYRKQDDYTLESIPVNLENVMESPEHYDIELKKDDLIRISSIFDLQEFENVTIRGSVLNPGSYRYAENLSLKDLILEANGLKDEAAAYNIEIARRIPDYETGQLSPELAEVIEFNLEEGLTHSDELDDVILEPYDMVFVRKSPSYEEQQTVTITGEVLYPGEYAITSRDFRLSDLLEKSGGPTNFAYLEGASLNREFDDQVEQEELNLEDSVTTQNVTSLSQVGIRLDEALDRPDGSYDLLLQPGDELHIPKRLQTVQIRGEVLYPINSRYESGKGFKEYINSAGGFTDRAKTRRAYIVYANGEVDRTKQFMFIRNYPEVRPGSVIIIPPKEEKEGMSTGELISVMSTIVSMAAIVTNTIFQIRRN